MKGYIKKVVLIAMVSVLCMMEGLAQYSEVSIAAGIANYWGDITPSQVMANLNQSGFNVSLGYHVHFDNGIGVRADLSYLSLKNADSLNEDVQKQIRNLSFRSDIIELAILGELHPIELLFRNVSPRISPYGILGVSAFYYLSLIHI